MTELRSSGALETTEEEVVRVERMELDVGGQVGDYVVLGLLGKGGMGVVYLAYDPKLQRKVALKLLRRDRGASDSATGDSRSFVGGDITSQVSKVDPSANHRLVHEAQSMARLAHPNVVSVYQVGEFDRRVFIAMEHIEGMTLQEWIGKEPRSTRALVDVMIQAGRGLQAAHEAGLVHRDFKAENVLIGKDGRVCVTDFGLASSNGEPPDRASTTGETQALSADSSYTNEFAGTPKYMAPEQHLRKRADARSDQFSFCVTLFRTLFGVWPFSGETYKLYADAVTHGRVNYSRIPRGARWLRPIFARGLSVNPDQRYPSMGALLAQLDRKPKLRNQMIAAGVGAVALASAAIVMMSRSQEAAPCGASETHLAGVWNTGVAEKVQTAMLATGVPYAASTVRGVTVGLNDYASQWSAMHRSTCEATRRGEQSEKLLDLRMACLDRLKGEFGIVVDLVGKVDAETIQHSLISVHGLSPVNACAQSESLSNMVAEPTDPEERKTLRRVQNALDIAKAELNIGHYRQSLQKLAAIARDVETTNYPPLQAEALLLRGRAEWRIGELEKAETTLMESVAAAERGRDDDKRLMALIELIYVVGYEKGHVSDGLAWAKIAEAMLSRVSSHERFKAEFIRSRATVAFRGGHYEDALRDAERSCTILQRLLGEDHRDVAECLNRIGIILLRLGRNEEALTFQNRALPIAEAALGKDHPSLGDFINNSGNCYARLGDSKKSAAMYSRALDLYRRSLGPEHSMVAVALSNLGSLAFGEGDFDSALNYFSNAIAIEEKTLGPKHQSTAETLTHLGDTYLKLGRPKKAVEPLERAWAAYADKQSPPPEAATVAFSLARALWGSGSQERAITMARRARELAATAEGEDGERVVSEVDEWLQNVARRSPGPKSLGGK